MYLFYFWLRRIFIAMHRLFLAAESKGYSLVALCGFLFAAASRCRAQALECMLNSCGSLVQLSCGIFPVQGSKLCPLPWQAHSQSLDHQGRLPLHFNFSLKLWHAVAYSLLLLYGTPQFDSAIINLSPLVEISDCHLVFQNNATMPGTHVLEFLQTKSKVEGMIIHIGGACLQLY